MIVDDGITRAPCIAMPDVRLALELKQVLRMFSGTVPVPSCEDSSTNRIGNVFETMLRNFYHVRRAWE